MEPSVYYAIDRIEGAIAVLTDAGGAPRDVPLSKLPPGAREGDLLREEGGSLTIDAAETERRKLELKERLSGLFKD